MRVPFPPTRVHGPEEAVALLRPSRYRPTVDRLLALFLDADHHVLDMVPIMSPAAAIEVPQPLLTSEVILISMRTGGSTLPRASEVDAWPRLVDQFEAAGTPLIDWLVVSGHRWRSLANASRR